MDSRIRRMIFLAILTSLALAISLIEHFFPVPLPIPGAKLGLSNMVILSTIVVFGGRDGLLVALLKSFLLMLVTGSVTGFIYSLAGSIVSSLVMILAHKFWMPPFSLVGVSELGALGHNTAQVGVAALVLENKGIFYYLPILTLVGVGTGFFVGLACNYLVSHLDRVFRKK